MRSTLMQTVDSETMRLANYFLGPFATGIVRDFEENGYKRQEAIVFALRVLDSDPVRTTFDKSLFGNWYRQHTAAAIRDACRKALSVHSKGATTSSDDVVALTRKVCNETIDSFNKGRMGMTVFDVFEKTFGRHPHDELHAFWSHLGVEMDSMRLFPLPWPGDPLNR